MSRWLGSRGCWERVSLPAALSPCAEEEPVCSRLFGHLTRFCRLSAAPALWLQHPHQGRGRPQAGAGRPGEICPRLMPLSL